MHLLLPTEKEQKINTITKQKKTLNSANIKIHPDRLSRPIIEQQACDKTLKQRAEREPLENFVLAYKNTVTSLEPLDHTVKKEMEEISHPDQVWIWMWEGLLKPWKTDWDFMNGKGDGVEVTMDCSIMKRLPRLYEDLEFNLVRHASEGRYCEVERSEEPVMDGDVITWSATRKNATGFFYILVLFKSSRRILPQIEPQYSKRELQKLPPGHVLPIGHPN